MFLFLKTVTMNGDVLAASDVTRVTIHVEDHRDVLSIVAFLHVEGAVLAAAVDDLGVAYLPEHLDVLVLVSNGHLADLALDPCTKLGLPSTHSFGCG